MIRRKLRRRGKSGAMAAEYVATMWLLFLFMFFPILNLATVGVNAFFLWFCTNQAATVGAKSQCFMAAVQIPAGSGTWYPGAYDTARAKAVEVRNMFPGIGWIPSGTNPGVSVICEPIDPTAGLSTLTHTGPGAYPNGATRPDPDQYTILLRVTIAGWASPLIACPWFDIPGLSKPMELLVSSQAQFENPPGLMY